VASVVEITAAVDAFMVAQKRILGHDSVPEWGPGFSPHEAVMKYPLEIEGELRGAQLMVVSFPRERNLKFRLGILFPAMICRLDYTDETHWPLNRRFFRGVTVPQTLHDAVPYDQPGRTFDAILRWFCADTNIESLPPGHLISLSAPELLI
jgi:hypothetical protein